VAIGGSLAFLPFLTLSLLPEVLLGRPLLRYEFTFLFLLLVPLAYGYAIFRYRLLPVNRYVSRGAATLLLITLLGGVYLILYAALLHLLPKTVWQQPVAVAVVALLLGATVVPVYRRLQIIVNCLLYGGWYDYRTAVEQISQTLDQHPDDADVAHTLCHRVQAAMQLQGAYLLLADETGTLQTVSVAGDDGYDCGVGRLQLAAASALVTYFREEPQLIDRATLCSRLAHAPLTAPEQQMLAYHKAHLWIPLTSAERLLGLLILAPKRGSDDFSRTDRDILEVVARQASSVLQNVQLAADLRQRAADITRLHGQLVRAREAERTRVAHELHDEVIQELVALNYRMAQIWAQLELEDDGRVLGLQDHVQRVMRHVRQVCADLRPPTLDTLGLVGAVRGHIRMVQHTAPFQVNLIVDGNEDRAMPDEVALCMFRVVQEALRNVEKHAAAKRVDVHLSLQPEAVRLTVTDDGQGFEVPTQVNRLLDKQHYGLVGLHERMESINGILEVTSTPGYGTCLRAIVPLQPSPEEVNAREGQHATTSPCIE
jgi:signal transduction histidine kinase